MAEPLAVEVDVKNVTEYGGGAAGQALLFALDVKGFLRSTYPIEQLRFSELGVKWANYRQLQRITADFR